MQKTQHAENPGILANIKLRGPASTTRGSQLMLHPKHDRSGLGCDLLATTAQALSLVRSTYGYPPTAQSRSGSEPERTLRRDQTPNRSGDSQ